MLVPLYTYTFVEGQYGIVTELYAYAGFLMVVFTYGMETAFFRFSSRHNNHPQVYSTALISVGLVSILLSLFIILLAPTFSGWLSYPQHSRYLVWFGLIIGLDALTAIPFARIRAENKPIIFASIKLVNIIINISLNLFFILLCPYVLESGHAQWLHPFIQRIYDPTMGIGYIFIANLAASAITLLLLIPYLVKVKAGFNLAFWKKMLLYAIPLLFVGLAGIVNEMLDRILLKFLLPYDPATNQAQLGIYGACYKLSILMTLFIQAFRYAAEPFFFAQAGKEDAPKIYSAIMKYFVIAGCIIFLAIMLYLDIVKYFIGPNYHVGLKIVPVLLIANLFLGMYYTLSIWYKLTDKTLWGAYISVGGAVITIGLNILLIPLIGYMGSAWATLACYASMTMVSWFIGQKYYPVNYPALKILIYMVSSIGIYLFSDYVLKQEFDIAGTKLLFINTFLIVLFISLVWKLEFKKPAEASQ